MKRGLRLVLAGLLVACSEQPATDSGGSDAPPPSGAGTTPSAPRTPPAPAGPTIDVQPAIQDLGILSPLETRECELTVSNVSSQPLRIVQITGSCECLSYQYDRVELAPGESQVVGVTVGTSKRSAKQLVVNIQVNDARFSRVSATIEYFTRVQPICEPARVSFGRRPVGNDGEAQVVARYELPSGVTPSASQLTMEGAGNIRGEAGDIVVRNTGLMQAIQVPVRFQLDASQPGRIRGVARLTGEHHEPLEIPVHAVVHSGFYLESDRLLYGTIPVGTDRTKEARLFYTSDEAPAVHWEASREWIQVSVAPADSGRFVRLRVTASPPAAAELAESVKVTVDGMEGEEVLHLLGSVK